MAAEEVERERNIKKIGPSLNVSYTFFVYGLKVKEEDLS
jgi:hypothetical protein